MNTYHEHQEFNDLLWGTPAPIMTMVNSQLVQLRARGSCSLIVNDASLLQEKMPDSNSLTPQVRSALANAVTDVIAQFSRQASSVTQLISMKDEITKALQTKIEPVFNEMGLSIMKLEIQAIESM